MISTNKYIGIDLGTSSVKILLVDGAQIAHLGIVDALVVDSGDDFQKLAKILLVQVAFKAA